MASGSYAIDATRGHRTMPGVASFPNLRPFGHRDAPRRYALPWFKALFATGVGRAPASNDVEQRLKNLNVFFTYFVYTNVPTRRQKST